MSIQFRFDLGNNLSSVYFTRESPTSICVISYEYKESLRKIVFNSSGIVYILVMKHGELSARLYSNNETQICTTDMKRFKKLPLAEEDKIYLKLKYDIDVSFVKYIDKNTVCVKRKVIELAVQLIESNGEKPTELYEWLWKQNNELHNSVVKNSQLTIGD